MAEAGAPAATRQMAQANTNKRSERPFKNSITLLFDYEANEKHKAIVTVLVLSS